MGRYRKKGLDAFLLQQAAAVHDPADDDDNDDERDGGRRRRRRRDRPPPRLSKTTVIQWITEQHRCWTTNGCVGLRKTWKRVQLAYPLLTKFITFVDMKVLLHDRLSNNITPPHQKKDCGLARRIGRRDILSSEQKRQVDAGEHVYGYRIVRHPVHDLMTHATHVILLDHSRPSKQVPMNRRPPPLHQPHHQQRQQLYCYRDRATHLLLASNPGTEASDFTFWVAVVLQFSPNDDDDDEEQTHHQKNQKEKNSSNGRKKKKCKRKVIHKKILLIPWTSENISDILHFPELWIILNQPLGPSYNIFVDQAAEIQLNHIQKARTLLFETGYPHELHIQPYGLQAQGLQCLVESAIFVVKHCRNQCILLEDTLAVLSPGGLSGMSMSYSLFSQVRSKLDVYTIA